MMDRERPGASDAEEKIPEAWIGQEVMIETTEVLSKRYTPAHTDRIILRLRGCVRMKRTG